MGVNLLSPFGVSSTIQTVKKTVEHQAKLLSLHCFRIIIILEGFGNTCTENLMKCNFWRYVVRADETSYIPGQQDTPSFLNKNSI